MPKKPLKEPWLFKNKRASYLVQQGLEDAKRGRLVKPKTRSLSSPRTRKSHLHP